MRVNIKDKKLVKMFNHTLKRRETILFFLIVIINRLIYIGANCGPDTFRIFPYSLVRKWIIYYGKMKSHSPT